jgi:hypothetical protein
MFASRVARLFLVTSFCMITTISVRAQSQKVHEKCLKAADYKGCIQVQEAGGSATTSPIKQLVESMKLLPSRISNSSRSNLFLNIQPFTDALSVAGSSARKDEYEEEVYAGAQRISRLIDIMADTWSDQISLRVRFNYSYMDPVCENAKQQVRMFNSAANKNIARYSESTTKFMWNTYTVCENPTSSMLGAISTEIDEITEDPTIKKQRLAKEKRDRELAKMAPWNRYLEENPDVKKWAESNPKAAEAEKEKFLNKLGDKSTPSSSNQMF